jgi:hypothetical protein
VLLSFEFTYFKSSTVLKVFIATGILSGCQKLRYPINIYGADLGKGGETEQWKIYKRG